jgi:archaellum component FlaG (FlaF/FlaG flagellin family)
VYSDSACNSPIGNLNWGSISPGRTATATVYVKNTGDSSSLTLSIQAGNWNPTSASRYLTLSWDKQGTVLEPGQSTEATIALTASSSVTGIASFSVQISISGTG